MGTDALIVASNGAGVSFLLFCAPKLLTRATLLEDSLRAEAAGGAAAFAVEWFCSFGPNCFRLADHTAASLLLQLFLQPSGCNSGMYACLL